MINFILDAYAKLPVKGSKTSAGYDIHCMHDVVLKPNERKLIYTGVTLGSCPEDIYLRVAPRSKLANKFGVDVLAGVVDSDYRGSIGVILYNTGTETVELPAGSAIAQLIPERIADYDVQEIERIVETARGASGINDKDLRL